MLFFLFNFQTNQLHNPCIMWRKKYHPTVPIVFSPLLETSNSLKHWCVVLTYYRYKTKIPCEFWWCTVQVAAHKFSFAGFLNHEIKWQAFSDLQLDLHSMLCKFWLVKSLFKVYSEIRTGHARVQLAQKDIWGDSNDFL